MHVYTLLDVHICVYMYGCLSERVYVYVFFWGDEGEGILVFMHVRVYVEICVME